MKSNKAQAFLVKDLKKIKSKKNLIYINKQYQHFVKYITINVKEYEIFKLELNIKEDNPLSYIIKLILGIFGIMISILWWIHM